MSSCLSGFSGLCVAVGFRKMLLWMGGHCETPLQKDRTGSLVHSHGEVIGNGM